MSHAVTSWTDPALGESFDLGSYCGPRRPDGGDRGRAQITTGPYEEKVILTMAADAMDHFAVEWIRHRLLDVTE